MRLTKRDENGEAFIVLNADSPDWTVSVNPLYEHTIQCEAIDKLAELEDAEEQGLLLRLPCGVGHTVYYINFYQGKIEEDTVLEFSLESYDWYVRLRQNKWVILGMFKKDFYLTRAEAESALAEKGGA